LSTNLNGSVTINEDTADNGGIKLAHRAYEKWLSDEKQVQSRLIALNFTPEQLFWISYAQFYCTVQRKENKQHKLNSHDPHSFARFRVLGPLMNSPEFARAFNCPINSTMNPERERCAIW
jgi:neprilysin